MQLATAMGTAGLGLQLVARGRRAEGWQGKEEPEERHLLRSNRRRYCRLMRKLMVWMQGLRSEGM